MRRAESLRIRAAPRPRSRPSMLFHAARQLMVPMAASARDTGRGIVSAQPVEGRPDPGVQPVGFENASRPAPAPCRWCRADRHAAVGGYFDRADPLRVGPARIDDAWRRERPARARRSAQNYLDLLAVQEAADYALDPDGAVHHWIRAGAPARSGAAMPVRMRPSPDRTKPICRREALTSAGGLSWGGCFPMSWEFRAGLCQA